MWTAHTLLFFSNSCILRRRGYYLYSIINPLHVWCFRCLWVWSTLEAKLTALVVQMEPIVCAQWRPYIPISATDSKESNTERMLAYCTGTSRIYFWRSKRDCIGGEVSWSNMGNSDDSYSPTASTSLTTSIISPPLQKQISKWFTCHRWRFRLDCVLSPVLQSIHSTHFPPSLPHFCKAWYRFNGRMMVDLFYCAVKTHFQSALCHWLDSPQHILCRCSWYQSLRLSHNKGNRAEV